jgi:AraC-like DNA-binding protein
MPVDLYNPHPLFFVEYFKHYSNEEMPHFHYHNAYEIYFLEQGEQEILLNDSIYKIQSYDVVLYKPGVFHRSVKRQGCTRTCLYFTDQFLQQHFTEPSIHILLSCFEKEVLSLDQAVFAKIKKLLLLLSKEEVAHPENRIFIYLTELLNLLHARKDAQKEERFSTTYKNLGPLLAYMNEHYNTITTLQEIADTFYLSKFHLCRLFKEATGLTLIEYLNKVKVQNACRMLLETDLSVSEIGLACGFNSSMYFCKLFKESLGMTPSSFRKERT